ncbi:hypothetical protein MN032_17895 [Agromyces atrinae]|uniref:hypothetical protein n=1 Tax=Agromyces atrinae TaxID=592376 RepID=UPI001F5A55E4|nr:hypothetical protein [Agromyces atrinae]MCI2959561.1 hypothetical protein [Agromyces atrinae]
MTTILGTILDSAGSPANGYLYVRQSARFSIPGGLVTQTQVIAPVLEGVPFRPDRATPLTIPASPEGVVVEIVEELRDGRSTTRWVTIPDSAEIAYADLVDVAPPTQDAVVPAWVTGLLVTAQHVTQAATNAGTSASDAAESAEEAERQKEFARQAAAEAIAPTAEQMALVAADPETPFSLQLSATIVTGLEPSENPEVPDPAPYQAVDEHISARLAGFNPAAYRMPFDIGSDLTTPRPDGYTGLLEWRTTAEVGSVPVHLIDGDDVKYIETAPIPWSPLLVPGIANLWHAPWQGLANGDLAALTDNGPEGHDMVAVGATHPTFQSAGINGHPAVLFDGVDDHLAATGFDNYAGPTTIYMVAQSVPASVTGTRYFFDGKSSTSATAQLAITRNASNFGAQKGSAMVGPAGDNAVHIFRAIYNGATPGSSLRIDDAAAVTGSTSVGTTLEEMRMGGRADGPPSGSGQMGNSIIGTIVRFRGVVPSEFDEQIMDWLRAEYDL